MDPGKACETARPMKLALLTTAVDSAVPLSAGDFCPAQASEGRTLHSRFG